MEKYRSVLTVIGFLLAGTGFLALIVSLVGLELQWLVWLKKLGGVTSFVIKLAMALGGLLLVYVAQVDWREEA
jgi:hypothetical protein